MSFTLNTGTPTALSAFEEMLGSGKDGAVELNLDQLVPYGKHHFKAYTPAKLQLLADDIKDNGLHYPIIVRQLTGDDYEILAGHNRVEACRLLGYTAVKCKIVSADDNEAALIVNQTNMLQRQSLTPTEKGWAYRQISETYKHQGKIKSTDEFIHTRDEISKAGEESGRNISRYIRLTYLIPGLADMIDSKILSVVSGVELSFLPSDKQEIVYTVLRDTGFNLRPKVAKIIRAMPHITYEALENLLSSFDARKPIPEERRTVIKQKAHKLQDAFIDLLKETASHNISPELQQHYNKLVNYMIAEGYDI